MSINRVVVSGNLTRDPELRQTAGGTSVLSLRMAVNDRRKNAATGQWEDAPNYVDVTIFGQRAEALSRFMRKGAKVGIEGKLRWSEWETPAGDRRSKLEIVADEVELFSGRETGGGTAHGSSGAGAVEDLDGEEIPF